MFLTSSLKKKINKASVVSFDIFDTLLLRPYVKPTDLFLHMEKAYHKPLFCICRIEAEQHARLSHPDLEDVSYDMIYEEIDDVFKDMKQKELDWEEMVLRANPEMKQVYEYAKEQGKRIVIASDMYLPTEFIAKVLRKCDYDGWDKLYVSADINARKGNGHMFTKIMSDLKIRPQDILHIGDNKDSDFKAPKKLKINTAPYQMLYKQYLASKKYDIEFEKTIKQSLGLSIIFSVMAYNWLLRKSNITNKGTYWSDLGYEYAGPVGYGYTRFVEKTAKDNGIDCLLFVARDGYLLQKIFNIFSTNIPNTYIYAPRFLNHICRLDYVRRNKKQAQSIIDFYAKENPEVQKLAKKFSDSNACIQNNKEVFGKLAHEQMNVYKQYLKSNISLAQKYALVDTITGEFSSQKIIQAALSKEVLGIYWGICDKSNVNKYEYKSFVGVHTPQDIIPTKYFFTDNWNFIEFLITSPEHPVKNIDKDGKPVYAEKESEYEIRRANLYPEIVTGALHFVNDIQEWFGKNDIYLAEQDIISWVNAYIENPSHEDIKQMQNICIGEDSLHEIWTPLFSTKIKTSEFFKSPKHTVKTLRKLIWRTPLQSFILCCCKPISIRMRGLKRLSVIFFPFLEKQYFTLQLRLSKRWFYKLTVGNMKG